MDNRSFESGAAASPPAAPASPSVGHPTAGDPQAAVPATKPGPYWFYQLGEELRAVLTAAGITPDKGTLTQLLTALRSAGVFTTPALGDRTTKVATMACFSQEFGASLSANGYQKLPSGLILQWGTSGSVAPNSSLTVTLPITFPNGMLTLSCNPSNWPSAADSTTGSWSASIVSTSQISINNRTNTNAGTFHWIALGY